MRGLFIVLTGTNGSGKTSIANKLNGNYYKFPNRNTPSGMIIDKFLKNSFNFINLDHQLKIFAENRREQIDKIKKDLESGINVICDRYTYCSLAYNRIKYSNIGFDVFMKHEIGIIKPDLVFLVIGDHLHLRNELPEKYHNAKLSSDIIDNYIDVFQYLDVLYFEIYNKFGELDDSINQVKQIIENYEYLKNNSIEYF